MRFVSFFAGIGGIDLGLERAGHECVGQVEIDDYCLKVLEKHWPDVRRWKDITKLKPAELPEAELWTAGFPCQDIANLGKRAGLSGERSGLFWAMAKTIRLVRPNYILLENVAALLYRGMDEVQGELAESRYDSEWDCLSAGAFGANHLRERVFVVAHPSRNPIKDSFFPPPPPIGVQSGKPGGSGFIAVSGTHWATGEPRLSEMADGVSNWTRIVSAYGNAVVPQVAEWIGRQLK